MSHSDSEIRDDIKRRIRKRLHVDLKAKSKLVTPKQVFWLNRRLKPIIQEVKLMEAVNTNNTERVKRLLEAGVSADTKDREMRSALHVAASKGYADIVQLLLENGADPNIRDSIQNTPLHLAACVHNIPVISLLIKANADVSCLDIHGRNPLQLVSSKLQILQKGWREGAIEMVKLRTELQQVIELLVSLLTRMEKKALDVANVDSLQLMKLSLDSRPAEQMDDQMSKLLNDLESFQIT